MPFVHLTESREILFAVDINTTFSTLVVSVVVVVKSSARESELESIVSLLGDDYNRTQSHTRFLSF